MSNIKHGLEFAMNTKTIDDIIKEYKQSNTIKEIKESNKDKNDLCKNNSGGILEKAINNCKIKKKKRKFYQMEFIHEKDFIKKTKGGQKNDATKQFDFFNGKKGKAIGVLELAMKEKKHMPPKLKAPNKKGIWGVFSDLFN